MQRGFQEPPQQVSAAVSVGIDAVRVGVPQRSRYRLRAYCRQWSLRFPLRSAPAGCPADQARQQQQHQQGGPMPGARRFVATDINQLWEWAKFGSAAYDRF